MKFIGIDPGKKTGFAVWCSDEQRFDDVSTLDFWSAINEVHSISLFEDDICIVIEDPGQNRPVFLRKLKGENAHAYNKRMYKIAKNVGQNIEQAKLLIERFRSVGYTVIEVRPTSSKKDAKAFKQITGYTGRTNEHSRDAAMLVFQMTETKMKLRIAA